jgi:hypothetical protein
VPFEHDLEAVTPCPELRKPFDVLAEGLVSEKSRGDRTPLELFIAGVRGWDCPERELTATTGRRQLEVEMTGLKRICELAERQHRK